MPSRSSGLAAETEKVRTLALVGPPAAGKTTLDMFDAARKSTPAAFHAATLADIAGCIEAVQRLADVLDDKAGEHSPSFRQALEAPQLQGSYYECWQGIRKHFNGK